MWQSQRALHAASAPRIELAIVLLLRFASLAQVERAHITEVGRFRAAVHALPDDGLIIVMGCTNFLAVAYAFEKTSHAVDVLLRFRIFRLLFALAVNKTAEKWLLARMALIVGTTSHRILLGLPKEPIVRVAQSSVFKQTLRLGLITG